MASMKKPQSVDERLIALIVNRTGGAKEIFRRVKDPEQLDGWDNQELYIACKDVFEATKRKAMLLSPDLIVAKLQNRGTYAKIGAEKVDRCLNGEIELKELDPTVEAIIGRRTSAEIQQKLNLLDQSKNLTIDEQAKMAREIADLHKKKSGIAQSRILGMSDWQALTENIEQMPPSVATGFPILDGRLGGGLPQGAYSLLVGHTGTGKSIQLISWWKNMLDLGKKTIYVNYEIERELFGKFFFAQLTGCNVMRGRLDPFFLKEKKREFLEEIEKLLEQNLLLLTDPQQGSSKMWNDCEDMLGDLVEETGAEYIFFDTINSVYVATGGRGERHDQYEYIANAAERFCLEHGNLGILFSAQPKQEAIVREDKRPQLMDVGGSRTLTEKAAAVMHLHRADRIDPGNIDYSEIYITKNRVNGVGAGDLPIRVKYDNDYKKLYEMGIEAQSDSMVAIEGDEVEQTFLSRDIHQYSNGRSLDFLTEQEED